MDNFVNDYKNLGLPFAIIVLIVSIMVWIISTIIYAVYKTIETIVNLAHTVGFEVYWLAWKLKKKLGF